MKTIKILFTIAALTLVFSVQAQRGARIGYIDMEYILESVPEYQEASTQLEGKVQKWKKATKLWSTREFPLNQSL